jgi:hypothetical protein
MIPCILLSGFNLSDILVDSAFFLNIALAYSAETLVITYETYREVLVSSVFRVAFHSGIIPTTVCCVN